MRFFFLATALALAACAADDGDGSSFPGPVPESSSSSAGGAGAPRGDGGTGRGASSGAAGSSDAGLLPSSCEGACRESSLALRKNGKEIAFDRTQFGFDRSASYPKLSLSAYHGGKDACPAPGDEPSHAVQIAGVPAPFDSAAFDGNAGITASLYDFEGNVIEGSSGVLKGTRVVLTPVAANLDPQSEETFVAFDVHLEFEQGIVVDGHAFATHCASIDQL